MCEFDLEKELIALKENDWLMDEEVANFLNNEDIVQCIKECKSPKKEDIFNAFKLFWLEDTKVLILGQDPYTEKSGKADGCAFSVANGKKDASLLNIFKAIKAYKINKEFNKLEKKDIDEIKKWDCDLKDWAIKNKVLLLNTALTHSDSNRKIIMRHRKAWKSFINSIIRKLMSLDNNKLVIFLWGKYSQTTFLNAIKEMPKFKSVSDSHVMQKMILMTSHPSNMGQAVKKGFSEDAPKHFKACDKFLGSNIWRDFPENN